MIPVRFRMPPLIVVVSPFWREGSDFDSGLDLLVIGSRSVVRNDVRSTGLDS